MTYTTDILDVVNWSTERSQYANFLKNRKKNSSSKPKILKLTKVKPVDVYALIDSKLGGKPNGFYTSLIEGYPLDNLFWWDFIIESEIGFINIIRSSARLEVQYILSDASFDVEVFLVKNIEKYKRDISSQILKYEEHRTYINHFKSYEKCTEFLWNEIKDLDLSPPNFSQFQKSAKDLDEFKFQMKLFTENCIKFHAMGKSMVLNAAFKIESFTSLFSRVTASPELLEQKELLNLHLGSNFRTKLKNLQIMSILELQPIDFDHQAIRDAFELMTLRNKYVHADESSSLNYLGSVYFDNLYPLIDHKSGNPIFETLEKTYLHPDYDTVKWAYETASKYIEYIILLVHPDLRDEITNTLEENPIGFNTKSHRYSSVYKKDTIFFTIQTDSDKD